MEAVIVNTTPVQAPAAAIMTPSPKPIAPFVSMEKDTAVKYAENHFPKGYAPGHEIDDDRSRKKYSDIDDGQFFLSEVENSAWREEYQNPYETSCHNCPFLRLLQRLHSPRSPTWEIGMLRISRRIPEQFRLI